jgi:hypothetical protein
MSVGSVKKTNGPSYCFGNYDSRRHMRCKYLDSHGKHAHLDCAANETCSRHVDTAHQSLSVELVRARSRLLKARLVFHRVSLADSGVSQLSLHSKLLI